jgi:type VI secretion system protein ImpH
MARKAGGSSPHLNPDPKAGLKLELLKEGHAFSFFQVMRLLRFFARQSSGVSKSSPDLSQKIRIKPNLSLAFPASDVERIEELEDRDAAQFLITVNFMGLYGSVSPLPTFYTEDLIDEEAQDESVSRDFIDILNQRLFALLFECWGKYQQYLQVVEQENSAYIDRLFCLLGLGEKTLRKDITEPSRLLRYIGLFTQFPHSALGLETLLGDAFGATPVEVIPCVERIAKIPQSQTLRLGVAGCRLGVDTYLGDELPDRMGKFRIRLGPLTGTHFKRFSPGTEDFERLALLTDLYFVEPLEYDVELILAGSEARTVCLGDPMRASLGVDSWIFSTPELGEVRAIFSPQPTPPDPLQAEQQNKFLGDQEEVTL